jgi:hypothetical protein
LEFTWILGGFARLTLAEPIVQADTLESHAMFIRKFRVRNYMVHQDTSIELQPLTVLVGPNGGGKSALFDAMLNFSMLARGNLRQAFGPYPYSFRAKLYRVRAP